MNVIIRLLKAPFTKHEYDFENAECTNIQPGMNPAQAYLTFVAECKHCPKKIKVDYYKYHGLLSFREKFGCMRSFTGPRVKPEPLHFAERNISAQEIETMNSFNTKYTPYEKDINGDHITMDEPFSSEESSQ